MLLRGSVGDLKWADDSEIYGRNPRVYLANTDGTVFALHRFDTGSNSQDDSMFAQEDSLSQTVAKACQGLF